MGETNIEWATHTSNWLAGCTRVSPACTHCYAEVMSRRQIHMASARGDATSRYLGTVDLDSGRWTGMVNYNHRELSAFAMGLRTATKPRRVFVNSMSDTFHADAPPESLRDLAATLRSLDSSSLPCMRRAADHVVMLLTKRPERLLAWQREYFPEGLPSWVWVGATAEDQKRVDERAPVLLRVLVREGGVRFLSVEPLVGFVNLSIGLFTQPPVGVPDESADAGGLWRGPRALGAAGLSWVIVGGESGTDARPMHPTWARTIRDQCIRAGVPFLFKQWGGWGPRTKGEGVFDTMAEHNRDRLVDLYGNVHCTWEPAGPDAVPMSRMDKKAAGRLLDGRTWDEAPRV